MLSFDFKRSLNQFSMRCRENKNEYGYYIPIIKTIENLLRNPEVSREIQAPHTQTGERLGDICDGYHVKQELPVDPDFMTLETIAYSDGVELGSKCFSVLFPKSDQCTSQNKPFTVWNFY